MKIINCSNYAHDRECCFEPPPVRPSLTVPKMALSMRELVQRYTMGGDVRVFPGVFTDAVPVGLERMDAMDKAELAKQLRREIRRIRTAPPSAPSPPPPLDPPAPPAPPADPS